MPYIVSEFSYAGRKGNQFYEEELAELLQPGEKRIRPVSLSVKGAGNQLYTAALEKSKDGQTITLDATLLRDGFIYRTTMTAVQVKKDLFEITELTFDNHKERRDARWETAKVLGHIGAEQLKKAEGGKVPEAHQEKGKFGRISRFFDRMIPDDPNSIVMPPM